MASTSRRAHTIGKRKVAVAELPGTFLTIATTRPETIPADTAVAVNPKDPRYQHLIGKHVYKALPLDVPKEQRVIPIIADDHVDFEFGTGVLKVTPAHDKADFEIGLRHKLPVIDVLTPDGKMTAEAGAELAGLDRFAARKKSAELMEAAGSLEKAEPYVNNVGFSERADVPIEPRLSEQWFLKYPSVEASKACVADGSMRFFPDRWAKVYDHWMGGIQDWCISRQLWWGIGSRCGTVAMKSTAVSKPRPATDGPRTPTSSTRGSVPGCGPSLPWVGPTTRPTIPPTPPSRRSTRPPISSRARTSSSSGSPA